MSVVSDIWDSLDEDWKIGIAIFGTVVVIGLILILVVSVSIGVDAGIEAVKNFFGIK